MGALAVAFHIELAREVRMQQAGIQFALQLQVPAQGAELQLTASCQLLLAVIKLQLLQCQATVGELAVQ